MISTSVLSDHRTPHWAAPTPRSAVTFGSRRAGRCFHSAAQTVAAVAAGGKRGAHLPPWVRRAGPALSASPAAAPAGAVTAPELNATGCCYRPKKSGADFNWHRSVGLTRVHQAADAGQGCLVSGQRRDLNRAGHLCAVVPETAQHRAVRTGERVRVRVPLMSQAGARNFEYGGRVWWTGAQFGRFGFWVHT